MADKERERGYSHEQWRLTEKELPSSSSTAVAPTEKPTAVVVACGSFEQRKGKITSCWERLGGRRRVQCGRRQKCNRDAGRISFFSNSATPEEMKCSSEGRRREGCRRGDGLDRREGERRPEVLVGC